MFTFSKDYYILFTLNNTDDIWNKIKIEPQNRLKPNLPQLFTN